MTTIANTLQIPTIFTHIAPPTPLKIYPPPSANHPNNRYPLYYWPNKVSPSQIPSPIQLLYILVIQNPPEITHGHWKHETTCYNIYNPIKNLKIFERPPRLENILRAKMMPIQHTIQHLNTMYHDKPPHIFIVCLDVLYLLNNQIKHPCYITGREVHHMNIATP